MSLHRFKTIPVVILYNAPESPGGSAEASKSPQKNKPDVLALLSTNLDHLQKGRFKELIESLSKLDLSTLFDDFTKSIASLLHLDELFPQENTANISANNETAANKAPVLSESVPHTERVLFGASNFADNWHGGVGYNTYKIGLSELPNFGKTSWGGHNTKQIFAKMGLSLGDSQGNTELIETLKKQNIKEALIMLGNNDSPKRDPMPEPKPENLAAYLQTTHGQHTAKLVELCKQAGTKPVVCTPVAFKEAMGYSGSSLQEKQEWHARVSYFIKLAWPNTHIDFHKNGTISPGQKGLHPGGKYLASIVTDAMKPHKSTPDSPTSTNEEVTEQTNHPTNIVSFGDSLAVGPALVGQKSERFRMNAKAGQNSSTILNRISDLDTEKANGATAVFISAGANDGAPNRTNIERIIEHAISLFGAKNVVVGTVPEYGNDPKYKTGYSRHETAILSHNRWLQEYAQKRGFQVYTYETGGLLHPKGYQETKRHIFAKLHSKTPSPKLNTASTDSLKDTHVSEAPEGTLTESPEKEKMFLTFDICSHYCESDAQTPTPRYNKAIESIKYIMTENSYPVTLFVSGKAFKNPMMRSLLIQASKLPHITLQTHGETHTPITTNSKKTIYGIQPTGSEAAALREIVDGATTIERYTGIKPKYIRSATLGTDAKAVALAKNHGLTMLGRTRLHDDAGGSKKTGGQVSKGAVYLGHVINPEGVRAVYKKLRDTGIQTYDASKEDLLV